jgi:transcriptional regulator with XRE-family HTH domain/Zn-dependent peptidase ImmA (M78 family)
MASIKDRLKQARQEAGLTQKQVSKRCGIDDSSLSSFEKGRSEPRLAQLETLARIYHLPLSYFFDDSVPLHQIVMWRNKPEDEKGINRQEIEAEFLQLCRQYRQLEIWTDEISKKKLPKLDDYGEDFGYPHVEEMASNARSIMGLGERPGESLYWILEEVFNIKIFHLDLGLAGVAACAVSDEFGKGILLNLRCCRWRRNHDLAHELFHLLTWDRFRHKEGVCTPTVQEEKFATCFAGNLLLPYEQARSAILKVIDNKGRVSFSRLDNIAREFDVSLESLGWRMQFLFNFNEQMTTDFVEKAKEYAKSVPRSDSPPPPLFPERYRSLAIKALQQGEISLGRFAKFMRITRREAEQFLGGRESNYAEVPIPTP